MVKQVKLTINGKEYRVEALPDLTLMRYLRDELKLVGAKNGCSKGHCGTCTVIIDDKAKRSCVVKIAKLDGAQVETIENLSKNGNPHPLQQAFIETGAIQCGFCTPGMIMAAKALLDSNLQPSEEEIIAALKYNICRCTGYVSIIMAVKLAAVVMRGEKEFSKKEYKDVIGASVPRNDAAQKVTGSPVFADDLTLPNMLYGKLLLSAYPHAEIVQIDTKGAEESSGVVAVLTARDIPGRNGFGLLNPNQPVLAAKRVLYIGDPVAVVYAETLQQAEEAVNRIKVDYKPLTGVFTPEEALKDDALLLHPHGNILSCTKVRKGNVAEGFEKAAVIVEGEYSVPFVEHAYMEPECGLACFAEEGIITLWSASQGSYAFRDMIAATLEFPPEKVRVIYTPAGGAFGGKEEPTVQIHCALGAWKTRRPVKMTLTREESIRMSTKRHAEKMHYKLGATEEGKLVAFEARVVADTGAYDSLGKPVVFRSGVVTAGPYSIPNVKIDSTGVYTNNPPGGAFRGFGSTQVAFAAEVHMDILARKLGKDPFKIREMNALETGKETVTGQLLGHGVGYKETLRAVEEALATEVREYRPAPGKKMGVGIASAYKNIGIGSGKADKAGAIVELSSSGELVLKVGAAEMGQGSNTVMAQFAAGATRIPYEEFKVISNDTFETPDGQVTTASRQTFISGNAVIAAATEFLSQLKCFLREEFNWLGEHLSFAPGEVNDAAGKRLASWKEIAVCCARNGMELRVEYNYIAPKTYPLPASCDRKAGEHPEAYNIHFAYCFATQAAIIEVDENTGEVKVLKIIAASDVGKAINPQMVRNQIEGAVMMGLGYGLSEKFVVEKGRVVTDNLMKLGVPRISSAPTIDVKIIEVAQPDGPFGAKGMSELPVNPTAPAIINAIYDAVGVRITELPASKEKILWALNSHTHEGN